MEKIEQLSNELSDAIRQSDVYKNYKDVVENIYKKNDEAKEKIDNYHQKTLEYQLQMQQTGKEDANELSKLQALQNALLADSEIQKYLIAEAQFSELAIKVNQILEDAVRID